MRITYYSSLIVLFSLISFQSQLFTQNIEFKSSNFKDNKEGLKVAEESIKKGDVFFEKAQEAYLLIKEDVPGYKSALMYYSQAQDFNPNNAELNLKIGICHLNLSSKEKAPALIKKAAQLDPEVDPTLDFYLGMVLQLEEKFDEAIAAYNKCKAGKAGEKYNTFILELIKGCQLAKAEKQKKNRIWTDNVSAFNTPADEVGPTITLDGELLMFSSNRENGHAKNEWKESDFDIYEVNKKNKQWQEAKKVESLNSDKDDYAGCFAYDGQRLMMQRKEGTSYDIYESLLNGLNWGKPTIKAAKMPFINETNESFACYEPNDIKIHFITDAGTTGSKDIYLSGRTILPTMVDWGKPSSVGHQINTKFHEGSIFFHPNGKIIYFSSQGHNSIGGYDIYKAEFVNGQWTNPVNLGYPINSPYDELHYAPTADGKNAYISSNRPGGKGGFDIYKVTYLGAPKEPLVDSEDFLLASQVEPMKNDFVLTKAEVNRQSLTIFKGQTIDNLTKKNVYAEIDITDNQKNEIISTLHSNSATGKFLVSLPAGKNYGIAVRAEGYLFHSENFNIPDDSEFEMVEKVIELKNIAIGSKITLKNIFFDVAKSTLKPESNAELDRIYTLLQEIPNIKIELSGHTDNTGSEPTNKQLSQDRANAVRDYLIKKGLSAGRITAKGYGSSKPIKENSTEEGRQQNRRTEFEIVAN